MIYKRKIFHQRVWHKKLTVQDMMINTKVPEEDEGDSNVAFTKS
jgi:hypothetical protein